MSALMEMIELIRLEVAIYHNARVCGDWTIREHSLTHTCFHMATQGDCYLEVPAQGQWTLREGDLVLFPRELPHKMWPINTLSGPQKHRPLAEAQDEAGTSMLCGTVRFRHRGSDHLLAALPPVLLIERAQAEVWLAPLRQLLVEESLRSSTPSNAILNRLCELLISLALRHYAQEMPQGTGLLALYAHRQIHRALSACHQAPNKDWQLSSLAREAAMSRTQFSQTFKAISGWTPMQYLTWWRMQLAWGQLDAGDSVAQVAEAVGYRSEAAFSRAFAKQFVQTPGQVRRGG